MTKTDSQFWSTNNHGPCDGPTTNLNGCLDGNAKLRNDLSTQGL